jgi:hypothetical protein
MNSKEKYNYSNKESQKLFEEFTILLGKITLDAEERGKKILYLENELAKYSSLKYMLKMIFAKIKNKFVVSKS